MVKAMNDIVVTGLAAISVAGVGIDPLREALCRRECLLKPVPEEVLGEAGHFWGKADDFRSGDYMPPLKARKFDRCSLFSVVAAGMALNDAKVQVSSLDATRIGIVLGSGFAGISNSSDFLSGYFTRGTDGLIPMLFPNTVSNAPASNASIEHGIKGPNVTFVQRFCSAETALHMACRFLEEDRADIVLTGGVDELSHLMMKGFKSVGQLESHARGFSEGAGILVLEREGHARQRGAAIKGRLGTIRTVGLLLPGLENEGIAKLLGNLQQYDQVSLSGTAAALRNSSHFPKTAPCLEVGNMFGRSLAMGGIALVSLFLMLPCNGSGLHLAASPEGPYFAVDVRGGAPA